MTDIETTGISLISWQTFDIHVSAPNARETFTIDSLPMSAERNCSARLGGGTEAQCLCEIHQLSLLVRGR